MILVLTTALVAAATAQQPTPEPSFGADVSIGYAYATISGADLSDRTHGAALFRLDSFIDDRTHDGPRLGLGLWGQMSLKPVPSLETISDLGAQSEDELSFNHVGISAVLRHASEAPVSGTFGIGFGRLEMAIGDAEPIGMPAFTVEGGARTTLRDQVFLDLMLRAHWATRPEPVTGQQIDWWFIELAALIGSHVR